LKEKKTKIRSERENLLQMKETDCLNEQRPTLSE